MLVGAASSLWWIDFNLYLAALGLDRPAIGLMAMAASIASTIAAFPASAISDRVGRRAVLVGSAFLGIAALGGLLASTAPLALVLCAAGWSVAWQAVGVVTAPFLTEHSRPEHRSELFAVNFAIGSLTAIIASALGGVVAAWIADAIGIGTDPTGIYRVIIGIQIACVILGFLVVLRIRDDHRVRRASASLRAGSMSRPTRRLTLASFGLTVVDRGAFARFLLPGLLIAIGAGQVIPFLNIFIQVKFGLDLASLNAVFALMSFGTLAAVLLQPALARRVGRIRSVLLVQGASIPFLVVLGFSPILWTVVVAMAVRNSLMNAGNPIFTAFAMDQVTPEERATLSAAMSLLWSLGWAVAGPWYSWTQATLGFEDGYAVNFVTIIVLYSVATVLYWRWFGDAEHGERTPAAG